MSALSLSVALASSQLASAAVVGVSGSRAPSLASLAACRWALAQLAPGAQVVTGCARGIDACARAVRPGARVVRASAFGEAGGRGALAARSVAVVRAVASGIARGGAGALWLSFPGGPCPGGLGPSRSASACFSGRGSGSWASLALAAGLGVPCLVHLPPGVPVPAGWPLAPLPPGSLPPGTWAVIRPAVIQSSLFSTTPENMS